MGKFKIGIDFDTNFLNSLTQEDNSGVVMEKAKHHLALHPIQLNHFNKSIKDVLNKGIAKYNKQLNGILLGYGNIKLLSNMGTISNDSPYIHYDLQVDFFIFKPEIGQEMKGTVNRRSKDHVGTLVYNAFNVSIPKPQDEDNWLGDSVNMGYEVLFRITFMDFSSYLPYIKGELLSIISEVDNGSSSVNTNTLKNKKIVFDSDEDSEEQPGPKKIKLEPELETKHKKTKKEKRKEKEINDIVVEKKKSKKKEKRKEKDVDEIFFEEEIPKKKKKRKEISLDEVEFKDLKHSDNESEVPSGTEVKKHKKKKRLTT